MVSKLLTEQDILDYLMTSDFNDGLTEEEYKFLLLKYRNFYRMVHSKHQNLENEKEELEKKLEELKAEIKVSLDKIKITEEEMSREKNRKLTLKERFFGKK